MRADGFRDSMANTHKAAKERSVLEVDGSPKVRLMMEMNVG
jgi:hypothetical protein